MSFSSLDADKVNGRELHNQNLMGVWVFKIYFYFFIFAVVICLVYFLWTFTSLAGTTFTDLDT